MKRLTFVGAALCMTLVCSSAAAAQLGTLRESRATQDDREGRRVGRTSESTERSPGWYEADYPQLSRRVAGSARKLSRGFLNIVASPFEIPFTVRETRRQEGQVKAYTRGIGRGILRVFGRIGFGVYDIATFPFRHDAQPLMQPEYVLDEEGKGNKPGAEVSREEDPS